MLITILKRFIPDVLPSCVLRWIKAKYYARAVQSFWEPDTEPIKHLVKPGDVVLDIGANVGDYTTLLAHLVGSRGRVYSVEPIPETFRLLSSVIAQLRLDNVRAINCAVSETNGSLTMEIPLHEYRSENFYQARVITAKTPGPLRQYSVPSRSLDSLFLEIARDIAFVKCDVEGHELPVIKGAAALLLASKPAWFIEISRDPDVADSSSHELFHRLQDHNYAAYWFDGKILRRRKAGDRALNYFFLQPSHVLQLAAYLQTTQAVASTTR